MCGAPSAVSVLSREYYCSVMMCFYSVILIPQGRATFTTMPPASLWQEVLQPTVRFYKTDKSGLNMWHCTHIHSHLQLGACCWSRVKYCVASPSRYRLPPPCPHLFSSQGQGDPLYDGTPFITAGTITGDVSLSENFKPILPPHLSLSLSSVSPCVSLLFGSHTLLFFPSP